MNKFRFFIASILMLIPAMVFAQMKVSGTVIESATGEPLPGVNIQIVGTTQGTTTDFDGKYQLENIKSGSVLEFSYVGYQTQQVTVSSATVDVMMKEDAESLDEVVIIGYGTAKKQDLTGSVNIVTAKDFNQGATISTQQLITGKIAGVNVTAPSGSPGEGTSINIRGLSSFSLENNPLFVIDGFPLDNNNVGGSRNPLDFINPNDIESVVVLKDASATAIYGSRAANGVVMITTKKAKNKDFAFNFSNKMNYYRPSGTIDMMSSTKFREVSNQMGVSSKLGSSNTNWQKEIFNDAVGRDHDLSGVGNLLGLPLRFSIGHSNQDGILKTDNMTRTTASLNLMPSLLKDYLKFEVNVRGMFTDNKFADRGAIGNAVRFDPTQPVYDSSSQYGGYFAFINPSTNAQYNLAPTNPVALLNLRDDISNVKRLIGNIRMDYKLHFFPEITATLNVGMDNSKSNGRTSVSELMPTSSANWNGSKNIYKQNRENKLLDAYMTYGKAFGNHGFKFMGGTSYQSLYLDDYNWNSEREEENLNPVTEDLSKSVMISYFGRLNYDFKDKFILTATLRADASSKLNPNDRWGYFPSAAFAWNLHNEEFFKNSFFNELKLRLGYGEVGNVNGLKDYLYLTKYRLSQDDAQYQFGTDFYNTYRPDPTNSNIKWEIGRTTNAGIDFSLLERRLSGSLNFYKKETLDLIALSLVDPFINFGVKVEQNIGNMENKGVELELSGILVQKDDVNFKVNYNIAYNDNKVTFMPDNQDVGGIEGGVGNYVQIHKEGSSPFSFNVYQQVYDVDGIPIEGVYVDRNSDGIINTSDKYLYKDPFADITMGLSATLKVNNFDLSASARSNIGNYMYNNVASSKAIPYDNLSNPYLTNLHSDYLNTGFQVFTETNFLSDHYVSDASFVKIDNVTLGLTFPQLIKNANVRAFGSLQNVATFTKYDGLDPEQWQGIDNNFYLRPRTFTFGFNLDF